MSIFDIFKNKDIKEKQKELNDKVEGYEKRILELENDIKALTERFDEFNSLLKAQGSFPTPNNPQLNNQSAPDNVKKNDVKEGEKLNDVKNTPDNSEIKDNEEVKTELNELNSVKDKAPKRRGRPKKIDKVKQEQPLEEETASKTNAKVEKTKTKQSKKPKSKNTKTNTKRGRKPKSTIEENKIETTTPPKRRGRPKKVKIDEIPEAAVMGLDYDETTGFQKPKEVKKTVKPVKLKSTDKIESLADVLEISNRGDE